MESATTVAGVVAAIRGAGQPHTTPAECRSLNAAFFADLYQVQLTNNSSRGRTMTSCVTSLRACARPQAMPQWLAYPQEDSLLTLIFLQRKSLPMPQEVLGGMRYLLQNGAHSEGSLAQQQLERHVANFTTVSPVLHPPTASVALLLCTV